MKKLSLLLALPIFLAACEPEAAPDMDVTNEVDQLEQMGEVQEQPEMMAGDSITDIAAANPDFSTLVAALQATGLDAALSGPGPYTVFAPTNAAFDALPEGTLEELLANPDDLANILTYHVVDGTVTSDQVVSLESAPTLQGSMLDISVQGEDVYVNDAMVTAVDIEANNGVIHVIDTVLIPGN